MQKILFVVMLVMVSLAIKSSCIHLKQEPEVGNSGAFIQDSQHHFLAKDGHMNYQWPEMVGNTGEQAKQFIESQNPGLNVQVLKENSPVTRDYRLNRVRIFVNQQNIVTSTPRTG